MSNEHIFLALAWVAIVGTILAFGAWLADKIAERQ